MKRVPLAWLQLKREKVRLAAAVLGIGFAVLLVFMQLGFLDALLTSSVRVHNLIDADIVLVSPQSRFFPLLEPFSRRRLYQVRGFDGVEQVSPLVVGVALWRHPETGRTRRIFIGGVDPVRPMLKLPELTPALERLRLPDVALFDRASRPEFGPVAELFERDGVVTTEIDERRISVIGLFAMGTSFGFDGAVMMTGSNFLRFFPGRPPGWIELGLIQLRDGVDPIDVRDRMRDALPPDVDVLTTAEYVARELDYWKTATSIGFIFAFGSVMGLLVGGVIAYQILFTDVSAHLPEYATLKAMGYRNSHLYVIVAEEAAILATLGFVPGFFVSKWLYSVTERATMMPLSMTWETTATVFGLTFLMCAISGALALRKVRTADPAEIF